MAANNFLAASTGMPSLSLFSPPPENQMLSFCGANAERPFLKIWPNRSPVEIWVDPELEVTEAARQFWEAVRHLAPGRQS